LSTTGHLVIGNFRMARENELADARDATRACSLGPIGPFGDSVVWAIIVLRRVVLDRPPETVSFGSAGEQTAKIN
jgi:hypothetical protein